MKINEQTVLAALMNDEITEDQVINALNAARTNRRQVRLADAQRSLSIGTTVEVQRIRPARLVGTIGVITGFNRGMTRADIKVTHGNGAIAPFGKPSYQVGAVVPGIPLVCLKAIIDRAAAKRVVKGNKRARVAALIAAFALCPVLLHAQTVEVNPTPTPPVTPGDVFAESVTHADWEKKWTEPTPLPGNRDRDKVKNPFGPGH